MDPHPDLTEIDESLRHALATLRDLQAKGSTRFAAIARRKIDDLLEQRFALAHPDQEGPVADGQPNTHCPRGGNQRCKGSLCGHCHRCGDFLDNHLGLGLDAAARAATRCPKL